MAPQLGFTVTPVFRLSVKNELSKLKSRNPKLTFIDVPVRDFYFITDKNTDNLTIESLQNLDCYGITACPAALILDRKVMKVIVDCNALWRDPRSGMVVPVAEIPNPGPVFKKQYQLDPATNTEYTLAEVLASFREEAGAPQIPSLRNHLFEVEIPHQDLRLQVGDRRLLPFSAQGDSEFRLLFLDNNQRDEQLLAPNSSHADIEVTYDETRGHWESSQVNGSQPRTARPILPCSTANGSVARAVAQVAQYEARLAPPVMQFEQIRRDLQERITSEVSSFQTHLEKMEEKYKEKEAALRRSLEQQYEVDKLKEAFELQMELQQAHQNTRDELVAVTYDLQRKEAIISALQAELAALKISSTTTSTTTTSPASAPSPGSPVTSLPLPTSTFNKPPPILEGALTGPIQGLLHQQNKKAPFSPSTSPTSSATTFSSPKATTAAATASLAVGQRVLATHPSQPDMKLPGSISLIGTETVGVFFEAGFNELKLVSVKDVVPDGDPIPLSPIRPAPPLPPRSSPSTTAPVSAAPTVVTTAVTAPVTSAKVSRRRLYRPGASIDVITTALHNRKKKFQEHLANPPADFLQQVIRHDLILHKIVSLLQMHTIKTKQSMDLEAEILQLSQDIKKAKDKQVELEKTSTDELEEIARATAFRLNQQSHYLDKYLWQGGGSRDPSEGPEAPDHEGTHQQE